MNIRIIRHSDRAQVDLFFDSRRVGADIVLRGFEDRARFTDKVLEQTSHRINRSIPRGHQRVTADQLYSLIERAETHAG